MSLLFVALAVLPPGWSVSGRAEDDAPASPGAVPESTLPTFLYATNALSSNISAWQVGASGALTELSGSPYTDPGNEPVSMAFNSGGTLTFVENSATTFGLSIYKIASNGTLSAAPGSPYKLSGMANHNGTFFYSENQEYSLNKTIFAAYKVASNGSLSLVPGSTFTVTGLARMEINYPGTVAYIFADDILALKHTYTAYSVGSNGALTKVAGSTFTAAQGSSETSTALTFNSNKAIAYLAMDDTSTSTATLKSFKIASNGILTPVKSMSTPFFSLGLLPLTSTVGVTLSVPFPTTGTSPDTVNSYFLTSTGGLTKVSSIDLHGPVSLLAETRSGALLYMSDSTNDRIDAYSVASNAVLTPVPGQPFTAAVGKMPFGMAVTSDGKYLYVANQGSDNVSGFSIAANGALTELPGFPVAAGSDPVFLGILH